MKYKYCKWSAGALFVQQLMKGWNEHLDVDARLIEAFNHGFDLSRMQDKD